MIKIESLYSFLNILYSKKQNMINLYNTHIETLSIHRVGNISRNEPLFLSEEPFKLNDEIVPLMKEFFFKSFKEKEENYFQFAHEVDLDYNDMFKFATDIYLSNPIIPT
jgi:hypothetical protein